MKIKRKGIVRITTKEKFNRLFKSQGYIEAEADDIEVEADDIEKYSKGGGWYEYEGKSYRKDKLIEKLGE